MSVSVINITGPIGVNKKSHKNTNIYTATVAGAASGLALRQFLPVNKPEIDYVLFGEADTIRENNIKQARKNVINETSKELKKDSKNPALKLFLERIQASAALSKANETEDMQLKEKALQMVAKAKERIKSTPEYVQNEIKNLTQKAINNVKAARMLSENALKNAVKQQRPYAAFILPGAALGALAGFVYNVVGTISEKE